MNLKSNSLAWQRRLRVWHRRLAIITAVQLLLWTVSGVYFAFIDIKEVRGEPHRLALPTQAIDLSQFDFPTKATSQLTVKPRLKGELIVGVGAGKTGTTNWLTPKGLPVEPLTSQEAISMGWDKTDIAADVTEWITTAAEAAE